MLEKRAQVYRIILWNDDEVGTDVAWKAAQFYLDNKEKEVIEYFRKEGIYNPSVLYSKIKRAVR